jgi:hypothetical protein
MFHFRDKERPTLCAYCKRPSGPFLYKDKDYWLGACCMAHLKKIGNGERLPNVAQLNDNGVEYAIAQTKDIYLKLAKEENQMPIHEWQRDNRKRVFTSIVRQYLNWANVQAQLDDERAANGSNKIHKQESSIK